MLEKLLSMISPEFGAEIPLFSLEQLQEGEFLQSAVHCAQLFANVQLEVLEVIRFSHTHISCCRHFGTIVALCSLLSAPKRDAATLTLLISRACMSCILQPELCLDGVIKTTIS